MAALAPQYKSSVSVSSSPPQSAVVNSGYGAFGNNTTILGNYSMNPPVAGPMSGTSLSYDDVLSSQYKDSSHFLSLQQNPAIFLNNNLSLKIVMDEKKWWSLFAAELIPSGQFVCEYAGCCMSHLWKFKQPLEIDQAYNLLKNCNVV